LDVSRIKQTIGFQAAHSLRQGLKKTIQWYQANRGALREVRL
jgi:dTDP-D-glucose 4,6-dehydratase